MDILQAIVLAFLQGLTEFLPISSSAHLILLPKLLGWQDQGSAFDVAVHIGTLTAVVVYFRKDVLAMLGAWFSSLRGKAMTDQARLAWYVILATIPVGLVGISIPDTIATQLRSPLVIAWATIVFALLIALAEKMAKENKHKVSLSAAIVIGLFQAIALIPGTSRSGITITAGLLMGLSRDEAARFSFLLSIPVIALAGLLKTAELLQSPEPVMWHLMLIGILLSATVAYLTIAWFLALLERIGLGPFVWYRLLLGAVLFAVFL